MGNRRKGRYFALMVPHKTDPGVGQRTRNDKARYIAAIINGHGETCGRCIPAKLRNFEHRYVPLRVPQKIVGSKKKILQHRQIR
jgi:hypothetical protein